jgi:predicted nucleic acid-binding protein
VLIVADTGPLISLAVIGQLDLLDALFYEVAIPEAVWYELETLIEEQGIPEVSRLRDKVMPVSHYQEINPDLGPGEKEAIILYDEIHADRLLIEDNGARLFAEARGIHCIGTLGMLIEAKDEGFIPALRPFFTNLITKKRYFALSLLNSILVSNSEPPL